MHALCDTRMSTDLQKVLGDPMLITVSAAVMYLEGHKDSEYVCNG